MNTTPTATATTTPAEDYAQLVALLDDLGSPEVQAEVAAEQAAAPLGWHGPREEDELSYFVRWAAREARKPRVLWFS